jgi:citrate synthase
VLAPGNPWIPFSPYVPKYNGHSYAFCTMCRTSNLKWTLLVTTLVTVCDHENNVSRKN